MTDSPVVAPVGDPEAAQTVKMSASGKAKIAALTEYVVLEQPDGDTLWKIAGATKATNAEAAIRFVLDGDIDLGNGLSFVAVPARSWKPVKVFAKTETRLVIEEAS